MTSWSIKALDTETSVVEGSIVSYLHHCGEKMTISRVMWVLEGPTTIVVDTGVSRFSTPNEFIGRRSTGPRTSSPTMP